MAKVIIHEQWKLALQDEFNKKYFADLSQFVRNEYLTKIVYPPPSQVFRALDLCPFDEVKVVIVGQDPYHGVGQANGLSFAVNDGITLPPSLKNIFKEIESDLEIKTYPSGDLTRWAKQGVLMLNAVLTVLARSPGSHRGKGWEIFTDSIIKTLNDQKDNIVYMLWGKYAMEKGLVIDKNRNFILTSGHPSPYSAHLFFGNHHFSRCNEYLVSHGNTAIDWK